MHVRPRPLPILPEKKVMATKRLPLWRLSDEMYINRQLAPSVDGSWTEIRQVQSRMKQQVIEQQKRDMREFEKELSGYRLQPRYPLAELRKGQWVDGRISCIVPSGYGVKVDIGAYTERGEWIDGFMHMSQIREDGRYVPTENLMDEVYLGETVRVRIREVVPATGSLLVSMRTEEDLPELFMGEPRKYAHHELTAGMKVKGIVRRVWDRWAIVDVGADRLGRLHVRDHKRGVDKYGFQRLFRLHKWAHQAYAVGSELDLWVLKPRARGTGFTLTCNPPRSPDRPEDLAALQRGQGAVGLTPGDPKEERMTHAQKEDRARAEAEKKPWEPYVPHVDEWLEDAMEPDEETDSWVARTEKELFDEMEDEEDEEEEELDEYLEDKIIKRAKTTQVIKQLAGIDADDFGDDDFAEDEFAEDDFGEDPTQANTMGFGEHAFNATELDGWVIEEDAKAAIEDEEESDKSRLPTDPNVVLPPPLSQAEVEALFDEDDDAFDNSRGWGGDRPPPR